VSVFDIKLENYAAYDKGRLPFLIDIMAFFRITDSNLAAQRVFNLDELDSQLEGILQGACRTILASSEIEEILEGRSKFGEMFTTEVDNNLKNWGLASVKVIELMDVRDAANSKVIDNIMAKKKSFIDMQSRLEVAENKKKSELAEVEAVQIVEVRKQEAAQLIGQRTAQKDKEIGVAKELAQQDIKEQEKTTAEKQMAVVKVNEVRASEIAREVQIVKADQDKQTAIIKAEATKQTLVIEAEGQKQQTITVAEGDLKKAENYAKGIEYEGLARGASEKAILMAPVDAQITLSKEIGSNQGYQTYLITVRNIEKEQAIGVAQSEALKVADIKVIVNGDSASKGIGSIGELISSTGGTKLGAMVEAFAQTPTGASVVNRLNAAG